MADVDDLMARLLSQNKEKIPPSNMGEWFDGYKRLAKSYSSPMDLCLASGAQSSCVGYAFAAGYQSAISALFKLQEQKLASLCVTESEGNHPRAIKSVLVLNENGLTLDGAKTFISGAEDAEHMFVACWDKRESEGLDSEGRPLIKLVSLPVSREGVEIIRMPDLPFIPEVSHGQVRFNKVLLHASEVLNGDGYDCFVKPFRTYEDLYVTASVTAYRLSEATLGKWGAEVIERHLALILSLRQLSSLDLMTPAAHVAFSACRAQLHSLIAETDSLFERFSPSAYQAWVRDKKLLNVASKAHEKRTLMARKQFSFLA